MLGPMGLEDTFLIIYWWSKDFMPSTHFKGEYLFCPCSSFCPSKKFLEKETSVCLMDTFLVLYCIHIFLNSNLRSDLRNCLFVFDFHITSLFFFVFQFNICKVLYKCNFVKFKTLQPKYYMKINHNVISI